MASIFGVALFPNGNTFAGGIAIRLLIIDIA